jgi:hypothetical protein
MSIKTDIFKKNIKKTGLNNGVHILHLLKIYANISAKPDFLQTTNIVHSLLIQEFVDVVKHQ